MKKILFLFIAFSTLYSVAQTSGKYTVENVSTNTEYSDYGTSYAKNKQVIFSSLKKRTIKSYIIKNIGDPERNYYDLYVAGSDVDGNLFDRKKFMDEKNTNYHNSDVVFTTNFSRVYFTRNNYSGKLHKEKETGVGHLSLFTAAVSENGDWTNIQPLPFNSTDFSTGHPALSTDNKKLYFISDMPGTSGKTDIYVVDVKGNNEYSKPKNLKSLNTNSREMFPFMSNKGVLYFASDRSGGMGGLDIYASKLDKGSFTEPLHLVAPINSDSDDFAFIFNPEKKNGYFSSNRKGGKGNDDIYSFVEDEPIKFECKQDLIVKVFDTKTKKPINGAQLFVFHDGKMIDEVTVGADGTYKMDVVACKDNYSFKTKMKGYNAAELKINTPGKNKYTNTANIGMKPIPIVVPDPVVEVPTIYLGPIYFNFDKDNIRNSNDADLELDRIIAIMNQYPEMIVSIESHTDSRGDATYNEYLSLNRAKKTKEYMLNHGISEHRIIGVSGLGETQLTNHCDGTTKCTEDEHQMNRRTMFTITNPESYKTK